jgi:hypothetical protein
MPLNSVFRWFIRRRMVNIKMVRAMPVEVQRSVFSNLLTAGRNTSFGKEHGFDSVKKLRDFQRNVPIRSYDEIKPWIDRTRNGESDVLWPGQTHWFAKSSGTTSQRSKYLPVTRSALFGCHFKGGQDLLALFSDERPHSKLYGGKHLVLGGSSSLLEVGSHGYTGDLSAILVENLPVWVESRRTPHRDIALMDGWEEKVDAMALATMREDVRILAGIPSWMLVVVKRVLERSGASTLGEVWPNLQLFMHGGVSFSPYRAEFESLIGTTKSKVDYLETHNASEGLFGLQDRLEEDDLLMMLDYGIYFEFVPISEWHSAKPISLELRELEVGKEYALVISTNAGLWRYALGDVIRVTEVHPFRMQVSGRVNAYLNAFGEELMGHQAEKAMAEACTLTGAMVRDYTAAPVYMRSNRTGGHEWLIEFVKKPQTSMLEFMVFLDASLIRQNSDYAVKRTSGLAIEQPIGHSLEPGTFDAWLKSQGKLGGQHKIPRLSNERDLIDQILLMRQRTSEGQLTPIVSD